VDVAALITSFATGTYTVTRKARGVTTRGRVADGTTTTVSVVGSVSPANPTDLLRLPEGRRTTDTLLLFTATQLYPGGQGATYEADRVSILSESWEVNIADSWIDPKSGTIGYRCILTVIR
jgi:hypothetical protein